MKDEHAATSGIREGLRRTWFPFFSRFGQLTEVQLRTIPRVLTGENVVVISPSASGKTEAIAAPLVERHLDRDGPGLVALYITPTRALVNDLYRRLREPMEYLGLGLARKTGDHPVIDEDRLPFMLITTPESLDSILCRHPRALQGLGAVVLDELHLLDNTPRGDQLRVLLERLRLVTPGLQYAALSATIDDESIGERYFPGPEVVAVPDRRDIETVLMPLDDGWHGRLADELGKRECRKALVFFNSRSWAESAAGLLDRAPFRGHVWVHHASLNRAVREEVEQRMNRERTGLLCCTSTLELGIDIGDIDAVALVRPPFNVSSLLQRIGRGNRRRRSALFMVGLHTDGWERFLFEAFCDCARKGLLCDKRYTPSLAVIPQQVVSYVFQRRRVGTTERSVVRVLGPVFGEGPTLRAFRHLAESGVLVEQRPGIYQLGTKLERQVRYGKIHSNIQEKSFGKYEVYDVNGDRHLGTVFFVFRTFLLGGRTWETVEVREKDKRVMVRPASGGQATPEVFEGTGTGGYGYLMARELKRRLFPGLGADEFPWFRQSGRTYLLHLLGGTYSSLIESALDLDGMPVSDLDGRMMALPGEDGLELFPVPSRESMREVVAKNRARLEDGLGSGAFLRMLPDGMQTDDHLLGLDIEGLFGFLSGLSLVEISRQEAASAISTHMAGRRDVDSEETGARF